MRECLSILILHGVVTARLFSQDYDMQWIQAPIPTSIMDFRNDSVTFHNLGNIANAFITTGNICDKNGNFLFFTNGIYVRDRNGNTMPNGDSLSFYNPPLYSQVYTNGMPQDQGVLILPKPESDSIYYIFHYSSVDTSYFDTTVSRVVDITLFFYYSVVDMRANNGLGDVVQKNIRLPIDTFMCSSRLTAVKHGNGRDWWVIRHGDKDNNYIKFLVTPDTILGPYYQYIGPAFHYNGLTRDYYGGSVFTQAGDRMATANGFGPIVVLDFDRCSGEFSNPLVIYNHIQDTTNYIGAVGLALSPNGRFLYAHYIYGLNQYDLWSSTPNDSVRLYTVDIWVDPVWLGTMRLGPNGKIYVATWNGGLQALHVINHPDSFGLACDFQFAGQSCITLNTDNLPNMVNYRLGRLKGSACDTLPYLTATGVVTNASCYGACDGAIEISHTGGLQPPFYYKWSNDSTTKNLASLCAGVYTVTVTDMWDTSIVSFTVMQPDSLFITLDSIIHDSGDNSGAIAISVSGGTPPYTFEWSNADTTEDIAQLAFGLYSVNITDANGCTATLENIEVEFVDAVVERVKEAIRIYPNPVKETLHVLILDTHYSILTTTLIDIHGKTILQQQTETRHTTLNSQHLAKGLYFLKVELSNGQTVMRKIAIQ